MLPNKKYTGHLKLAPPVLSSFPGFEPPQVSTPVLKKSHTAVFLKKAMSKSVTPKKKAKNVEKLLIKNSSSEPRQKKVNFQLTKNMSQVSWKFLQIYIYKYMYIAYLGI